MSFFKKLHCKKLVNQSNGCYNLQNPYAIRLKNVQFAQAIIIYRKNTSMHIEENHSRIYIEKQIRVPTFTMTYEHSHNFCEIFYLKTGSCVYTVNNNMHHLSAGELFIVKPGDTHATHYEGLVPCERIAIYCDLPSLPDFFFKRHPILMEEFSRSGKVILVKKGQKQVESLLEQMLEENNLPDEYSYDFLYLQVMSLLLSIQRNGIFVYEQMKSFSDLNISTDIENVLRYIAQNFSMTITLEDVAEHINLSPTYLSKKFKKITGLTFVEYVNYIRIRQACQMLITTDDNITKIAVNCGFNSSNYFKDCFRRIIGMSPREFRNRSKNHSYEYDINSPIESLDNLNIIDLFQNL